MSLLAATGNMDALYRTWWSHRLAVMIILVVTSLSMDLMADSEIAESMKEGKEVLRQLEALLSDPNFPLADKMDLESSVAALVRKEHQTDVNSPPLNSECDMSCCQVHPALAVLSSQKPVYHTCQEYITYHYSQSCGVFNLSRCKASRPLFRTYICSSLMTDYYTERRPCPSNMYTCCAGYVWYKDCCLISSELKKIIDEAQM